jgi:hypothetical protein
MRETYNIHKFYIPRISNTRFSWRDVAALFVWKVFEYYFSLNHLLIFLLIFSIFQHLFQIICFLVKVVPLEVIDLKRILWLLHPEVQCAIGTRAVLAAEFLLPGMEMAKSG